ncbi:MAG TPA: hypothetical protein VNX68_11015 [Nitrosopumilaceae archaeon]|nr:hypothetical protein [Nitrosopumilaceae archaeon]
MKATKYDVSEYSGFVKARVLTNYWRLPEHAKGAIGVEDCIQDALMYLHKALNCLDGFNEPYDKSRSKITTYIYRCIDSYFSRTIVKHMTQRRAAFLITIDELPKQPAMAENATNVVRLQEAIDKVTKLHLDASPALIDFIATNLYLPRKTNQYKVNFSPDDFKSIKHPYTGRPRKVKCSAQEVFQKRKQELLALAKRHEVTADHYRLALSQELK